MVVDELAMHPIITRNLEAMGYASPRPIQALAIGPVIQGRDVIGLAKTGTGKTAAFLAPIAHALITAKPRGRKGRAPTPQQRLRALVLAPTRELAQQIATEAAAITQGSVLRTTVAFGKVAISPQEQAIARGVDLLVATPGRIRELLDRGSLDLQHIAHVVIDEADRMLDMGFLPQVQQILRAIPEQRQTLLFTSTMPAEVEELARRVLREAVRIEADPHSTPVEHVSQHLLPVKDERKVPLTLHMIQSKELRGVLVFCRTRRRVGWVNTALQRHGVASGMLRGDMSQAQRRRSLDRFSNRELRVLVATDVAGRGLHIPAVKTVINYDLPPSPEEYVHRMGRAAHGGGRGDVYTLLSDDRDQRLLWRAILDQLGVQVFAEAIEGFESDSQKSHSQRKKPRTAARQYGVDAGKKKSDRPKRISRKTKKKSRPIKPGQKPGRGVVRH